VDSLGKNGFHFGATGNLATFLWYITDEEFVEMRRNEVRRNEIRR